jgi:hypothetical protein
MSTLNDTSRNDIHTTILILIGLYGCMHVCHMMAMTMYRLCMAIHMMKKRYHYQNNFNLMVGVMLNALLSSYLCHHHRRHQRLPFDIWYDERRRRMICTHVTDSNMLVVAPMFVLYRCSLVNTTQQIRLARNHVCIALFHHIHIILRAHHHIIMMYQYRSQ